MSTPIGKLTPDTAKTSGRMYRSAFCCLAKGLSSAEAGMFFVMSWRWVVNVVADIRMISTTVTTFVAVLGACMNVEDSDAPKIVACSNCCAIGWVIGPMCACAPEAISSMLLSTRNRPKKNGDCTRIGRHELKGLVPSFLYSSIVSWVIAWRDSGSDLPLYFFWIFCSSGWIICILRDAMICLTNSGIIAARMTTTRPTIENAQVQPEADGMPIAVRLWWKPYMIQATNHSMGWRIVLMRSPMSSLRLCRAEPAG